MCFIPSALRCVVLAAMLATLAAKNAYAYLDPGTGSYILQLVAAALLGVAFAVKMFWFRIKAFLSNLISRRPKDK